MAGHKQLSFRVSNDLYSRFTQKLDEEGKQSGKLLAQLVEYYCEGNLPIGSEEVASEQPIKEEVEKLVEQKVEQATSELREKVDQLQKQVEALSEENLPTGSEEVADLTGEEESNLLTGSNEVADGSELSGSNEVADGSELDSGQTLPTGSSQVADHQDEQLESTSSKIEPQPLSDTENDVQVVNDKEEASRGKNEGLSKGWSQKDLATRLGCSSDTVRKYIKKNQNEAWAKNHDPDGLAWQYDSVQKMYFPKES